MAPRTRLLLALAIAAFAASLSAPGYAAARIGPAGWTQVTSASTGRTPASTAASGTVWEGSIPNTVVGGSHRQALVYLPPNVDRRRRYPVLYLLHGLRGSPFSFTGGLRFASAADSLIARGRVRPFIAVMPPAGRTPRYDGEWTGPWERYVVNDVLPWAQRHLPVELTWAGRSAAGFSAGAYGALDIGLRHPGLFHTIESWSGYYTAPHDGSLAWASGATLAAHSPTLLARRDASTLRRLHTRVFVSLGANEPHVQAPARRFAALLTRLDVRHRLLIVPGQHNGRTWRRQLTAALTYALGAKA